MADRVENLPATEGPASAIENERSSRVHTTSALELVAMRGRDVIGVRHLMEGGRATIGSGQDALARVSMKDFGGVSVVVAEVTEERYLVRVPPRARARVSEANGLARLVVGPHEMTLGDGDKAVVVLGPLSIRAKVVPVQTFSRGRRRFTGALRWVALVGALYVVALALCAVLSQPSASSRAPRAPTEHSEHTGTP